MVDVGDGVICAPDPTGATLRWPARLPLFIGVFVISVVVALALQRHEFTSPDWALALLVAMAVPWVLDMFSLPPMSTDTRFRYPVLITWSVVVIAGVWILGTSFRVTIDFAPFLLVMLIGEMTSTCGAKFGAVVLAACMAVTVYSTYGQHISGNLIWQFAYVIGFLGGLAYRTQTRIATELLETQEQLAERAKEEERRHLAREIHDLIAHSLAVTMLHLSGARLALAAGDTKEAIAALSDAESSGRAAMAEVHRSVGLLGTSADVAAPPTPSATDLPELVDGFQRAGLEVRLCVDGDLGSVPLAPGLTAYRVVQESLSNAVKHAPGAPVDLQVAVHEDNVAIRAVNDVVVTAPHSPSGGHGLLGMAERAALLGGTVVAGIGDGSWNVNANIPWSEPA